MHDTVNRNHRCTTLYELCQNVKRFSTWSYPSQVSIRCSTVEISYLALAPGVRALRLARVGA